MAAPAQGTHGKEIPPFAWKLLRTVHTALLRGTRGLVGHNFNGQAILLLTVTGAKSGKPRTAPLQYHLHGDNFLVVASKGGSARHPAWYTNLVAHPECTIEARGRKLNCRARTATASERPQLWEQVTSAYSGYAHYQESTDRQIPVVILEPQRSGDGATGRSRPAS
jgi:deazaflavin-dependent oxidoreductase (nitroreductase family)